jgi:hypothetical protein
MKPLPVGIQSFSDLRKNGYLYIDKTEYIYRMITTGKPYFLSRPRRFGKSLLVSTLDELFKGNKTLFEGLYIYDKYDWEKKYPVIRLDLGDRSYDTSDTLKSSLHFFIDETAKQHNVDTFGAGLSDRFSSLIRNIRKKHENQVVVLIDEYDKPIIDHLNNIKIANANRKVLHDMYQVLKATDDHLKFIFLTGVSKFTKTSIFSGLNNLKDITIHPNYASICGYTEAELLYYFAEHIVDFANSENISENELVEDIRRWYNGYSWDGRTPVYNPYCTLLLFDTKSFDNHWFESGTPTFLIDLIRQRNDIEPLCEPSELESSDFNSFDTSNIDTKLLLFQTGYLTVKSVAKQGRAKPLLYTIDIPNEEVRESLMKHLVALYAAMPITDAAPMRKRMMTQLINGDTKSFERAMQGLFARIPHQLHIQEEAYYHSLMLLWLNFMGFEVIGELSTDKGRIDAVWQYEDRVVIAEIKYSKKDNTEKLLIDAFKQIKDNRYYERYAGNDKRIALLAIAFAGKEIACEIEEMKPIINNQ